MKLAKIFFPANISNYHHNLGGSGEIYNFPVSFGVLCVIQTYSS